MKTEAPLKPGDLFLRQFEIRRLIGTGGYAFVYEAFDQVMGRDVALKLIEIPEASSRDRRRRARLEAQVMARLSHPNIVRVYAGGVADERWTYLVMELLRGRSLRQVLLEHGTLTLGEAFLVGAQVADAVHAAHLANVIHRDLKPDNIFIERNNVVRLIDFGIAKLQGNESPTTQKEIVHGTGLYMSPEHLQGLGVTPRSDVFALGVILYEAIFGCCPAVIGLEGPDLGRMTANQIQVTPPALHELLDTVPAFIGRMVHRMIAKQPIDRLESMAEAGSFLRAATDRLRAESRAEVMRVRELSVSATFGVPVAISPESTVVKALASKPIASAALTKPVAFPAPLPHAAFPTAPTAQQLTALSNTAAGTVSAGAAEYAPAHSPPQRHVPPVASPAKQRPSLTESRAAEAPARRVLAVVPSTDAARARKSVWNLAGVTSHPRFAHTVTAGTLLGVLLGSVLGIGLLKLSFLSTAHASVEGLAPAIAQAASAPPLAPHNQPSAALAPTPTAETPHLAARVPAAETADSAAAIPLAPSVAAHPRTPRALPQRQPRRNQSAATVRMPSSGLDDPTPPRRSRKDRAMSSGVEG